MRYLLITAALLLASPALAAPELKDVLNREITGPIDRNQCVEVHWTEKAKRDHKILVLNAPLDQETLTLLREARSRSLGILKRCRQSST